VPCGDTPRRLTIVRSTACRAAGRGTGLGRGPHPQDDVQRAATGRTGAHARGRAPGRLGLAGVSLPHPEAARRERAGTAGLEPAAVPACHHACGQDGLEEAAEQRHAGALGRAAAGTAPVPGGAGDGPVPQAHEAAVGEGHWAAGGSAGGAGGGAVGRCLTVDMPGERPPLSGVGFFCPPSRLGAFWGRFLKNDGTISSQR
jgi:hypothetical protein